MQNQRCKSRIKLVTIYITQFSPPIVCCKLCNVTLQEMSHTFFYVSTCKIFNSSSARGNHFLATHSDVILQIGTYLAFPNLQHFCRPTRHCVVSVIIEHGQKIIRFHQQQIYKYKQRELMVGIIVICNLLNLLFNTQRCQLFLPSIQLFFLHAGCCKHKIFCFAFLHVLTTTFGKLLFVYGNNLKYFNEITKVIGQLFKTHLTISSNSLQSE